MKAHPAADIFPMIEGDAWTSFIEDIKVNGVRHPVITHDDMILDGRNRYRACQELGIDCPTKPYEGGAPVAYVISANLQRRHMTTSQRAAIAAELANMVNGSNQHSKKEGMQNCTPSLSLEEAANLMQVSRRSAAEAKRLMRDDPAAHEAVKRGEKPAKQSAKKGSDMSGYFRIAQEEGAMPLGDAGRKGDGS